MKKVIYLLALVGLLSTGTATAQSVRVVKYVELEQLMQRANDTTYVINFWATWCGPCVKELPYFEEMGMHYSNKKLKILLVNLDFRSKLESTVIPFIKKRGLQSEVWLLNESNPNDYIDQVSTEWSGAIPATVIVNNKTNKRLFYEQSFTQEELNKIVKPIIVP